MNISELYSDLIACSKLFDIVGFRKDREWACELLSSLADRSNTKLSSKQVSDLAGRLDYVGNRCYKRAKTCFYQGQYQRAAFYLKDLKQTSLECRSLYYHSQFMAIETERINTNADGESVSSTIKYFHHKFNDLYAGLEKDLKKIKPDSWVLLIACKILLKLNRIDQAFDYLLQSIRLEPLNRPAWDLLSSLIKDRQHLKSLDTPPRWLRWFFHGSVDMKLQMFEEAYDLYTNAISKYFPNSAYVISQIAVSQNELRDIEAAVDSFKLVRSRDPYRLDEMDVYSNALYVSQRRYELSSLAHAANEIEPFRPETCFCLANFYSLRAQHEKAATYFSRALQLDPTNVCAWILMGHEYMEMKKTEEAIKAYRSAISLDRTDQRAWYGLGQLYEILKLPNISLDNYLEAHKLKPTDTRITIALADTYEKLEWYDQAVTYYRRAGGTGLSKLAPLLERLGKHELAFQAYIQFLEWLKQMEGYDPMDTGKGNSNPEISHAEQYIKQHQQALSINHDLRNE